MDRFFVLLTSRYICDLYPSKFQTLESSHQCTHHDLNKSKIIVSEKMRIFERLSMEQLHHEIEL